jgi:hypothetical protein
MKRKHFAISILVITVVCLFGMPGCDGDVEKDGCNPDDDCARYTVWCDETSDLCWQTPQKDAYDYDDIGLTHADAIRYCQELVFGGYDDWRLPDIDALRTLVRGNTNAETGGACPLTEGSTLDTMQNPACGPLEPFAGPGPGGCYWSEGLLGTCDKPDPAAIGHPLEYMASTVSSDNEDWVGVVLFDNGAASFNHILTQAEARCARDAPTPVIKCSEGEQVACLSGDKQSCECSGGETGDQICAEDGACFGPCQCSDFVPSPPPPDVCGTCDSVKLTMTVPSDYSATPRVLMAFLYSAEGWEFPPNRPPDGGNSDNQLPYPVIGPDRPLEMVVPGCTYYRDECITGDFYLYVALVQDDIMMVQDMREGDYWWGVDQDPMTFGSGSVDVYEKNIELVPFPEGMNP